MFLLPCSIVSFANIGRLQGVVWVLEKNSGGNFGHWEGQQSSWRDSGVAWGFISFLQKLGYSDWFECENLTQVICQYGFLYMPTQDKTQCQYLIWKAWALLLTGQNLQNQAQMLADLDSCVQPQMVTASRVFLGGRNCSELQWMTGGMTFKQTGIIYLCTVSFHCSKETKQVDKVIWKLFLAWSRSTWIPA